MSLQIEQRILIIGLTYPTYRSGRVEPPCAKGLLDESFELRRIHPVPKWYLDQGANVHKFQWSTASIHKHERDSRPESFMFEPGTLKLGEVLPYEPSVTRRYYLESSPYMCRSVAEFRRRWEKDRTSMAIIKPKEITGVRLLPKSDAEHEEWARIERQLMSQKTVQSQRPTRSLKSSDVHFMISWRCDEPNSPEYEMPIGQWGLHFLYDQLRGDPERDQKVVARIKMELDLEKRDLYMFLGCHEGDEFAFELMDSYRPKKLS